MAYRTEGRDLIIDGFGEGITDNPYDGFNEMVGCNIISVPGEISTGYAPVALKYDTYTGTVDSADAGTDVITVSSESGTPINGATAVVFTGGSLPTGITAATVYWLTSYSAGTFKIYSDPDYDNLVNITGTGTGTFASVDMTRINHFAQHNYQIPTDYCIDDSGRAWGIMTTGYWKFFGNVPRASETLGNGIFTITSADNTSYLFLCAQGQLDYVVLDSGGDAGGSWVAEWNPATGSASANTTIFNTAYNAGTKVDHPSLNGQDGRVYIADDTFVMSFYEVDGQTFDPTTPATLTFNKTALAIPSNDQATCLAELGAELLVGGQLDYIYPWDRKSPTFRRRIWLAEKGVQSMITINTTTYVFAGSRGRIYRTEGSSVELFKKIPDHLVGIDPKITFTDTSNNRNQIYFGMTAVDNAGTASTVYNGLWAMDVSTGALRQTLTMSGTDADVTAVLATPVAFNASAPRIGYGVYAGWEGASSTYGIDGTDNRPTTDYTSYFVTEMIPIATLLERRTFEQIEFLLSTPMVSTAEGVKIEYRNKLGDSWAGVGDTYETLGSASESIFSDVYTANFENNQFIQLKVSIKSTSSTGMSYTRVREIRIR